MSTLLFLRQLSLLPGRRLLSSSAPSVVKGRPERLFPRLHLELRAHQPAVLKSYAWFICEAAKHLEVPVTLSEGEPEAHKTRKTLLKSVFVHSKHRVQYEMQTYFWTVRAANITESTKDTFLEYVQRNLPEGVSMKVTATEMAPLPEAVKKDLRSKRGQQDSVEEAPSESPREEGQKETL